MLVIAQKDIAVEGLEICAFTYILEFLVDTCVKQFVKRSAILNTRFPGEI